MDDLWLQELADDSADHLTNALLDSSSEDEASCARKGGGSRPGKAANIERGRDEASARLYKDYFAPIPVYNHRQFERGFRLSRAVFNKVLSAVKCNDVYFSQRRDCTGKQGLSSLQKVTAALCLLDYGSAADSVDKYVRIGESTALECMKRFAENVVECFGEEYLRSPTSQDIRNLLRTSAKRGFPGMIGSQDCCKWACKNCPTEWHGQYSGKEGVSVITVEAVADGSLWIWHAFFGMPGCANDINVFEASSLCNKISEGSYPPCVEYEIKGEKRNIPYWLTDRIYPKCPFFVQTFTHPVTQKEKLMARCQEAVRKDVEREFGVLQAKWYITSRPSRIWRSSDMKVIMKCCIVLHNMMV